MSCVAMEVALILKICRVFSLLLIWIFIFPHSGFAAKKKACDPADIPEALVDSLYKNNSKTSREREKLRRMVQIHGPVDYTRVRELLAEEYTHQLPNRGVRDQGYAGDCWIEAQLNVVRHQAIVLNGYQNLVLSRSHLKFWSIFEHVNLYLEELIQSKRSTYKKSLEQVRTEIQEGGFFHWGAYLIKKYGVVPYEAMPDNAANLDSTEFMSRINHISKKHGMSIMQHRLRYKADAKSLRAFKEAALTEVWRVLVAEFGLPPREFDYRETQAYEISNVESDSGLLSRGHVQRIDPFVVHKMTPQAFRDEVLAFNPDDYVVLGHFPNLPLDKKINIKSSEIAPTSGNMVFANVSQQEMMQAVIDSILQGLPVWIGVDYSHNVDATHGVIDPHIILDEHIGPRRRDGVPELSRADLLRVDALPFNHAMVILGFDAPLAANSNPRRLTPKHVQRFLIENSHGAEANDHGYVHMSRDGFESNMFEIVVHKNLLSDKIKTILAGRAARISGDMIYEIKRVLGLP